MHSHGISKTHPGSAREVNEDSFFVDNDLGIYIVCDGMGGHAAGEVASALAVKVASKKFEAHRSVLDRARQAEPVIAEVQALAEQALHEASAAVFEKATSDRSLAGMGTTMTLLVVLGEKAVMAHVGDTRLYLVRGGVLHQLSNDHTLVSELLRTGALKPADAKSTPFAHVLSRSIGTQQSVAVDTLVFDVLAGDEIVMCTDGLHDYLDEQAAPLLERMGEGFETAPESLVEFAIAAGGHDNITVVAVKVERGDTERQTIVQLDEDANAKIEALSNNFLFEQLNLAQLFRVLEVCELEIYESGKTIVIEGDPCCFMLVVLDGELEIIQAGRSMGRLRRGDMVGDTTLLAEREARASVTVVAPTRVMRIDGAAFSALVLRRPYLGVELLRQLGLRLGRVIDRGQELIAKASSEGCSDILRPRDLF